ncbi:hypothetical protein B0H67DRAFT_565701 [Lasiosphaeris hirsuta]|uniref:Uncharacterized protein n=1 Tax=Lasiosphaeris hirsuta TaxID=260670 RepID=A0AA40BCF8_9PEZI|nr:hypothetical protein B0H67DRAFT_565701 [Lasiosphaeris hirsuta]
MLCGIHKIIGLVLSVTIPVMIAASNHVDVELAKLSPFTLSPAPKLQMSPQISVFCLEYKNWPLSLFLSRVSNTSNTNDRFSAGIGSLGGGFIQSKSLSKRREIISYGVSPSTSSASGSIPAGAAPRM